MSLSAAFNIAQSSLFNSSRQTSVLSRNVQEANNPDYTRRTALLVSTSSGAQVVQVRRAADDQLFRQNLSAISAWSSQSSLSSGLDQLDTKVNGVDGSTSVATILGKLQQALQTYSASPSSPNLAATTVEAARSVVRSLNDASTSISAFRADADGHIATAVDDLNNLLAQFKTANDTVVSGSQSGRDVNDALDKRDTILKKIAEYVPVTVMSRENNDMALFTNGATLFEKVPRSVSFQPSSGLAAGSAGNPIRIDGVPVTLGVGGDTNGAGKIAGMLQLRDDVTMTVQRQLDEVARGLITTFAETSRGGGAAAAGLFTWSGAPAIPAAGTLVDGLAASISVNAAFDPAKGGNPQLIRDGGANGADYVANTTGAASYTTQINAFLTRLDQPIAFDASARAGTSLNVSDFAATSLGWFQAIRKDAATASETKEALASRTAEALSNATGVNVDEEMSKLLDLENGYQASSRLIKAVDDMMAALLAAVS
jgi:flagellar hook-associated protein 1 FlgK